MLQSLNTQELHSQTIRLWNSASEQNVQPAAWADRTASRSALFIISHQAKRRDPQVPSATGSQVPTN